MKKVIISLLLITGGIFTSCEDTSSENVSNLTVYPVITLEGDDPAFVEAGTPYTDPGATGTISGVPVDLDTQFIGRYRKNVFSELDTNVADVYNLEYSAMNSDGFTSGASRQVIVAKTGDLVNSIEGLYTSTVTRNGAQGSPASAYTDIEYILIWKNADGTYEVSDAFGGWYLFARAIGGSESPGGKIVANSIPGNSFTFPGTFSNSYFGGSARITALTVDPATKKLVLTCVWQADAATTYTFVSTLTQVQF